MTHQDTHFVKLHEEQPADREAMYFRENILRALYDELHLFKSLTDDTRESFSFGKHVRLRDCWLPIRKARRTFELLTRCLLQRRARKSVALASRRLLPMSAKFPTEAVLQVRANAFANA